MKHMNITITGKVQGVFFRASTKQEAETLNINGWVANQNDGSVFVSAEGDESNMQQFITWLHEGPPLARVETVSIEVGELENQPGFVIK